MKLIKFFLVISIGLFTAFNSFANLKNSSISLGGGTVSPRETLTISLDKLVSVGSYNIVCQITDNNNDKNKVMMLFSVANSIAGVQLNGRYIGATPAQSKLNKTNTVVFPEIASRYGSLMFSNMDQDDSVKVESCVATPVGN